ncbi:MAG: xanthine dehydrogenase molybdenum-binding subunit XdhA [Proteobacteria bacterium]|nr:xanthine dehydrogenase molybdenum-binding subunit XdhA [Pseudomonadota bacterium]
MKAIGKAVDRVDAVAKVTGRAQYTDDFYRPGMLTAKYFRSAIAHGKVKKIDTSKARELAGVEAIFTFSDVPQIKIATAGHPYSMDPAHADVADKLLLTSDIHHLGDEIAVVVAENELIAEEALELIEVEYEELPALTTAEKALAMDAIPIHGGTSNVVGEHQFECGGSIQDSLQKADLVYGDSYKTNMVQHLHLENHTAFAYMDDLKHIVIVSSTQIPHIARRVVGQALDIPWGRVRVIKPYIGGGFGNKQDVVLEPMVAFLTGKLDGRPVRITLTREECMLCTRNRHPMNLDVRLATKSDGTLLARQMEVVSLTGGYASHGHSIVAAAGSKSCLLYPRMAIGYHARTVYTNIPVGGAMRAYGSPQIIFALESAIDDTARSLKIDPVEFRIKNAAREGDLNPFNKKPISSCGLVECLEKGRKLIQWDEKKPAYTNQNQGNERRGLGVACFSYGTGTYPVCVEIAGARIIFNQDASIHVQTGATEIGQGSDTTVAQMAAETIGISVEDVHIVSTQDTDVTPFDTGSYASRQAYVVGNAVFKAATELKGKILDFAEVLTGFPADELSIVKDDIVHLKGDGKAVISLKDLALNSYYDKDKGGQITADVSHKTTTNAPSFGCTFVDITVDIALCKVYINEIYNIHDSGVILNPVMARGQVEGGVAMAIGAALSEQVLIDEKTGWVHNNNMLDYKVPTFTDIPDIRTDFVETIEPTAAYGNKSLGEPPIISPPPAIRNAILDATGVAVNELPMTPQVLYRCFKEQGLIE